MAISTRMETFYICDRCGREKARGEPEKHTHHDGLVVTWPAMKDWKMFDLYAIDLEIGEDAADPQAIPRWLACPECWKWFLEYGLQFGINKRKQ